MTLPPVQKPPVTYPLEKIMEKDIRKIVSYYILGKVTKFQVYTSLQNICTFKFTAGKNDSPPPPSIIGLNLFLILIAV